MTNMYPSISSKTKTLFCTAQKYMLEILSNVNLDSCMKEVDVQKSRMVEGNTMRKTETKNKSGIWTCFVFFFFG